MILGPWNYIESIDLSLKYEYQRISLLPDMPGFLLHGNITMLKLHIWIWHKSECWGIKHCYIYGAFFCDHDRQVLISKSTIHASSMGQFFLTLGPELCSGVQFHVQFWVLYQPSFCLDKTFHKWLDSCSQNLVPSPAWCSFLLSSVFK